MALRAFYFIRALTYCYINRSQRHLLVAIENSWFGVPIMNLCIPHSTRILFTSSGPGHQAMRKACQRQFLLTLSILKKWRTWLKVFQVLSIQSFTKTYQLSLFVGILGMPEDIKNVKTLQPIYKTHCTIENNDQVGPASFCATACN